MAIATSSSRSQDDEAAIFQAVALQHDALGDPTRLRLMWLICEAERAGALMTVGALAVAVKLAQPTVTRHVAKLAAAGYVVGEREGQKVFLHTDLGICDQLRKELDAVRKAPRLFIRGRPVS
jgi:DNA-binding transcriptional ArsR family regulator